MGFSGVEADGVVMESSELRSERVPPRQGAALDQCRWKTLLTIFSADRIPLRAAMRWALAEPSLNSYKMD